MGSMLPNLRRLPRRGRFCIETKKSFEPGAVYFSQIVEKKGEWVRLDYSEEGWNLKERIGEFWKGTIPEKEEKPKETSLLELLDSLHESHERLAYLVALYLQRQRVLKKQVSGVIEIFEEPQSGNLYRLQAFSPEEQDIENLKEHLADVGRGS